jgi:hypothetical protein
LYFKVLYKLTMENTNNPSRPEDELQYIRSIIADSRASFVEDGKPYVLWGLIVAVGMGITYISVLTQRDLYIGFVWMVLVLIGWGSSIYYLIQQRKQTQRAPSFLDRIQRSIWTACGSALGLGIVLILVFRHSNPAEPSIHPFYVTFVTSLILGIAYYLSGIAHDIKWLRNIGFAWWGGAIVMYLWPSVHVIGINAAMLILFQVVPGIVLMRRYKRITSQSAEA